MGLLKNILDWGSQNGSALVLRGDSAKWKIKDNKEILEGIEEKVDMVEDNVPKMKRRITEVEKKIVWTEEEMVTAKSILESGIDKTDPETYASYQRQVILLEDKLVYLKGSLESNTLALKKTQNVMAEAKLSGEILKERIEDAEISFKLSGQVVMIGNALSSFGKLARENHRVDLGQTIEGLQESINEINGGRLLALAGGDKK